MNQRIFIPVLLVLALSMSSCLRETIKINASNRIISKSIETTDFSQIQVEDAFEVFVKFSSTEQSIVLETNDNLLEFVEIQSIGGNLEIGLDRNVKIKGNPTFKVFITTDDISTYEISGASFVKLMNEAYTDDVQLNLSGASRFEGYFDVVDLDLTLSGASSADIDGGCNHFFADFSGASSMKSYGFETNYLDMDLSGASSAKLTVWKSININASGASSLYYKGDAVINNIDLSGASTVKHVD